MFLVKCTLPYASTEISGIPFRQEDGYVETDPPVTEDVAAKFRSIPGYEVIDLDAKPAVNPDTGKVTPPPAGGGERGRGRPSKADLVAAIEKFNVLPVSDKYADLQAQLEGLVKAAETPKAEEGAGAGEGAGNDDPNAGLTPAQIAALDRDGDGNAGGSLKEGEADGAGEGAADDAGAGEGAAGGDGSTSEGGEGADGAGAADETNTGDNNDAG